MFPVTVPGQTFLNFMYCMIQVRPKAPVNECKSIQIPHKYTNTNVCVCVSPRGAQIVPGLL